MKRTIILSLFCLNAFCAFYGHAQVGDAYMATCKVARDGYEYGGKSWQEDHDAWVNGSDDQPMPEELNHIEGEAYLEGGKWAAEYEGEGN